MHTPDFDRFRALLDTTAGLFNRDKLEDAMVQAYWNALRDLPIEIVEACAKSHQRHGKFFPKPFELRPKDEKPRQDLPDGGPARNHVRDYWRSCIVHEACAVFGQTVTSFEPVLIANKDTLGPPLLALLNELEQQDRRDGRTIGQHRYVQRRCDEIARGFRHLRTDRAPPLQTSAHEAEELFA
ncbi:MAG: hypothetical protein RLZZ200_522 [Pseudomonadota bacterium]|jgi:hypothetical protein